jgi:Uma2 family endonuclease
MMVAQEPTREQIAPVEVSGDVVAAGVSLEDYMERYAGQHYEWVEGMVIRMVPEELKHNDLVYYLYFLFQAYFELKPIGRVVGRPFTLRLPQFPNRRREPDLMIVLKSNPNELKDTFMNGAPDICIEVVSEESTVRDHGDKFAEYEAGGVPEYWILDILRRETRFYRLGDEKRYVRQNETAQGVYHTPALPYFMLSMTMLWQDNFPGSGATYNAVKSMLGM